MPTTKKTIKTETKKTVKKTISKSSGFSVPVFDINGKEKGTLDLPKAIFSVKANNQLIAQAVRVYQSNQRQGTASTKTRGEVIGSTRKIYRQKGTGRARHGSIKAPIFVGGGIVGGPRPKDFTLKINKKQKTKAFFGVLSLKLKEKGIIGIDDKALDIEPKTKLIAAFIKKLELNDKKIIFVLPKIIKNNFILAGRNIEKLNFEDAKTLNLFQVLNNSKIIFFESAMPVFIDHFLKNSKPAKKV